MQLDAVGLCNIWDLSVTSIRFLRLLYVQVENFIPGNNYVFIRFVLITLDLVLHLMKLFLYLSQFEGSHHLTRYSDLVSLDSHMQHHKSGIKLTLFTTGQVQPSELSKSSKLFFWDGPSLALLLVLAVCCTNFLQLFDFILTFYHLFTHYVCSAEFYWHFHQQARTEVFCSFLPSSYLF